MTLNLSFVVKEREIGVDCQLAGFGVEFIWEGEPNFNIDFA